MSPNKITTAEYAAALREIAQFYEQHPDMPVPFPELYIFSHDREEFLKAAAVLAKGGKIIKRADPPETSYGQYHAIRTFGCMKLDLQIARIAVCRKIQDAIYECPDSLLEAAKEYTEEPAL